MFQRPSDTVQHIGNGKARLCRCRHRLLISNWSFVIRVSSFFRYSVYSGEKFRGKLFVRRRERICRRPGLSFGVGGADLAQLNHLFARLNHRSPDLISTREQDTVTIFAPYAPSPDRNLEIGKPGAQPLAEVTCLSQSAGR